jgi:hypothetical protein
MFADEPVALITKSRGNAKYKIYSENKFRSNAQVSTSIFHRNGIKTKARSFSKIVYLDDRSTVSLYPKTEVTINGIIDNRIINKQLDVTEGIVKIKVFKQNTREFKLITPHSELTCHECDFWVISDENIGDRFIIISGNGFVTNPSMIEKMEFRYDSTIISLKDRKMEVSETPVTESKYLESLMLDADEIPVESDEELGMKRRVVEQSLEAESNVVEIRLKNAMYIERKIILTYTK